MRNEMDAKTRGLILKQLRIAVDSQIELWETAKCIEEMTDCDINPLLWIQSTSIVVDSGMELGESDLDAFLDPSQEKVRCANRYEHFQSNSTASSGGSRLRGGEARH